MASEIIFFIYLITVGHNANKNIKQ